ncbi:hypothetical protein B484DRAFT_412489, partial [Ochromonadaceae sp. CCMP2298]
MGGSMGMSGMGMSSGSMGMGGSVNGSYVDDLSEMQSVLSESDKESLDVAMSMMGQFELRHIEDEVLTIQNNVRGWLLRKNYTNLRESARVLQGAWRERRRASASASAATSSTSSSSTSASASGSTSASAPSSASDDPPAFLLPTLPTVAEVEAGEEDTEMELDMGMG